MSAEWKNKIINVLKFRWMMKVSNFIMFMEQNGVSFMICWVCFDKIDGGVDEMDEHKEKFHDNDPFGKQIFQICENNSNRPVYFSAILAPFNRFCECLPQNYNVTNVIQYLRKKYRKEFEYEQRHNIQSDRYERTAQRNLLKQFEDMGGESISSRKLCAT